jgi:hypothetical protein
VITAVIVLSLMTSYVLSAVDSDDAKLAIPTVKAAPAIEG